MSPSWLEYLRHIRDEANYLAEQLVGLSELEFLEDGTLQRAFVRSLEIIGEATKKLPAEIKEQYGGIDWRAIAGMRDRLIHAYFGVDHDIVWDVVTSKVPELLTIVSQMIVDAESDQANGSEG